MLTKIITFSIKNKLIVGLFVIGLIVYGSYEITKLPIDAVPDITNNQVQVITVAPSYGASDIERLVTFPIEQVNNNISGLKEIRSFSRFGLSLVTIVFDDATDIYWARQQVAERLQKLQGQIPQSVGTPELGPISTGLGEIYQYVLRTEKGYEKKYNEMDLRTMQDWIVRRQLLGVKGVAEVSSFGGKLKQYEIAVNLNKLQALNLTINEVFTALEKNNQNTGGTYIEKGATALFIRSEGLLANKTDIENIFVKNGAAGTPIFMRDVANVHIGYATRYGAMCYNNKGEVAGAVVMMLKGANSSEVIKNVKERIAQIQKTLPDGVIIEPFLDRTKMVNNAIHTVEKNLMEGALIVVFVLVLFLGNFRAGFLVASVIPLSMLIAIILMNSFGVSGNLMSLGALDFGLIVDGAVIIVEAVMHRITHYGKSNYFTPLSQKQMDKEVGNSAGKMMNSAVFGQIIILIVYLPIFTLQGIEGKMFKPMAQTVAFALIGAFVLSLTYIPMMSALFLGKKTNPKLNFSDRLMFRIETLNETLLIKILRKPKIVIGAVITLFIMAIIILSFLGGEFIPAIEEGDFAVESRVLTGSNLNTTIKATQQASAILLERFPEVEKVVTKIGSSEIPTDPMPLNAADIIVNLKNKSEWTSASSFNELAKKMSAALEDVPGLSTSFQYPVQMRFNELMTGAKQDVVCKIFGENIDTLTVYAEKMASIIKETKGATALYVEKVTGISQIVIQLNREAIAQYGLSVNDINKIINTSFAGQSAGLLYEEERRFNLVVRLDSDNRKNLEDVKNILIPTPMGTQVPLYHLANIDIKQGPNQIQREDAKRRIIVGFNVQDRDVESIVNELQEKVNNQIKFPSGYYPSYGGAFENLNSAKKRLMLAVPVSLVLIYILLFFAFNSLKQGLLIYSAIPLSTIGGILFLAMRGMPFSISAGVGFIALFGVAVLNGIVLIAEFNRLKEQGITNPCRVVIMGTKTRIRPVLMTAAVASLGFLPMAISNGAGAEVQRPLATVVIGGLLIATFLTLFVLPVLYVLFEKGINRKSIKNTKHMVSLIFVIAFFSDTYAQAQFTINLKSATDTALNNNLKMKNEKLKQTYREKLIKSAANISPTSVQAEYGQINSYYYDTRFSVSQSFNFPTVYTTQKQLLSEEWKSSGINVVLKKVELQKEVRQFFYLYLYLKQKETLLLQSDSMYKAFVAKAELKLKSGESNVLEKSFAETQMQNIMMQLVQVRQALELCLLRFQLSLNTTTTYIPYETNPVCKLEVSPDTSTIMQHPLMQLAQQQKNMARVNLKVERSKLLPDLNVGYANMTMRGTGADEKLYNYSTRFQSVQVGLGLPLFFGYQKARINAYKITKTISENEWQYEGNMLRMQYKAALLKHEDLLKTLNYLQNNSLPNATTIISAANQKYTAGDIDYMEWVILMNQAISTKLNYQEVLQALNENIIELNYLQAK